MVRKQDNAASVRGVVLRVTKLDATGAPAVGTDCDVYLTGGFINLRFTPQYSEGDEVEQKNAAGEVCVYYKAPDVIKNVTVGLEICDPDPILTQLLVGGEVLTEVATTEFLPNGAEVGDDVVVGYASPPTGIVGAPYGVAIEVWAQAIVGNKPASGYPYWRYLIPHSTWRLDGDRVVEVGRLATVFAGTGNGNVEFGEGPNMDLTGVTPLPGVGAFDWPFPQYTDRAFSYARGGRAPVGLSGVFDNIGTPLTAIVAGVPATFEPDDGNRPANLSYLQTLGDLGNTDRWDEGDYVLLGDGSEAFWDGDSWAAGRAVDPIEATGAVAGTPGTFTPSGAETPANLAGLAGVTATPTTAWTTGQRVVLGDASVAHWDGTSWESGAAP